MAAISAVAAYQRALEASKKIQPSKAPMAILRQGDNLQTFGTQDSVSIGSTSQPKAASFGAVLEQELIKAPINKIKSASRTMFEIAKSSGTELGPNLVQLVEATDRAQMTVNAMVAVRDKIINAYQEILKMPL